MIKENITHVAAHQNNILLLMGHDSKSHAMTLWCVISIKMSIAKKIAGLELMTLNSEKM